MQPIPPGRGASRTRLPPVDGKRAAGPAIRRRRTYNVRLIKASWPYSIQEIASLFGVHKNAVLRWLREGLQADKSRRPFLVRGDELIRFLKQRQQARKRKCAERELYCFRCRAPREVRAGTAEITIESKTRFRVKARCDQCDARMCKVQGIVKLTSAIESYQPQKLEGQHLIECAEASLNRDLELSR